MVRLRRPLGGMKRGVKFSRINVFARDEFRCQYCGTKRPAHELNYDHVVPARAGRQDRVGEHRDLVLRLQLAEARPHAGAGGDAAAPRARSKPQALPHDHGDPAPPRRIPEAWSPYCAMRDVAAPPSRPGRARPSGRRTGRASRACVENSAHPRGCGGRDLRLPPRPSRSWKMNRPGGRACLESSAHPRGCGDRHLLASSPRWKQNRQWCRARLLTGACPRGHGVRLTPLPPPAAGARGEPPALYAGAYRFESNRRLLCSLHLARIARAGRGL